MSTTHRNPVTAITVTTFIAALMMPVRRCVRWFAGQWGKTFSSVILVSSVSLANPALKPTHNLTDWPEIPNPLPANPEMEHRIDRLLDEMTLAQKVAQMIQPEIRDVSIEEMRQYGFGSYLNGGGSFPSQNKHATPQDWIALAEAMYQASIDDSLDGSTIPTMWGTDAVHGHNNVIGATLFPHNIGLGAANNPSLIRRIAQATATEVMVTGIDWVFAPTVAVARDDRWGRTYESYSEDPNIVRRYAESIVEGLQGTPGNDFLGDRQVISTVKHFIGDGGTLYGDDQGDNLSSEHDLIDIHAQGYVGGLAAGAQTVMASFNSWHGKKVHGDRYLLTDVLKTRMGFDGLVVGDWSGHGQVVGCSNESCAQAINAGLDIFMAPTRAWKPLYENTLAQVRNGQIPEARIDDAVRRILRVKMRAGLFTKPSPQNRPLSGKTALIGAMEHREIARQAVRESLVLLKNQHLLLPLDPRQHILVTGDGADNITKQSGGWSITWQGTGNTNADFPGGSSIYAGLQAQVEAAGGSTELSTDGSYASKPDVAIVVYGEDPYAEGHGDRESLEFQRGDKQALALLKTLQRQDIPVVSVFLTGRPLWVNPELNASDAFIVAWLPGSEGKAVADVLLRDQQNKVQTPVTGKLSFSWPRSPHDAVLNHGEDAYQPLFPLGYGLQYGQQDPLSGALDETVARSPQAMQTRNLYVAKTFKPWLMSLYNNEQELDVSSNSHAVDGLDFRTIDKDVQEDAVQLKYSGNSQSGFRLVSQSNFREDLRADLDNRAALQFSIRLAAKPIKPLWLAAQCDDGTGTQCGAKIDIQPLLASLAVERWQQVSIDIRCLASKGMQYADTVVPFDLSSEGPIQIGLANILLKPDSASQAMMTCP